MNARLKVTRLLGSAVFAVVVAAGILSIPALAADYPDDATALASCTTLYDGAYYLANDIKCPLTVKSGRDAQLYLNGHDITYGGNRRESGAIVVEKDAKLEIFGEGSVKSTAPGIAALVNDQGEITLSGGMYQAYYNGADNTTYYAILNEGDMVINDGVTVKMDGTKTTSSLIANGPVVINKDSASARAKITINGGEFMGGNVNLKNDEGGSAVINGGKFIGATNAAIQNWNELTINDGSFDYKPLTADIKERAVIDMGAYDSNHPAIGETIINGGSFTGKYLFEDASTSDPVTSELVFYPSTIKPVITGGEFNIEALVNPRYEADESVLDKPTITGGVFAINTVTPADGYELKELTDGKYEVIKHVDEQPITPPETPNGENQGKADEITAPSTGATIVSAAVVVLGAIVAIAMAASAVNAPSSRRK